MTGPRPSEAFPAVDPTHDVPAAVELIRRIAAEQHPYDAVLLGMAADMLEGVKCSACDGTGTAHTPGHYVPGQQFVEPPTGPDMCGPCRGTGHLATPSDDYRCTEVHAVTCELRRLQGMVDVPITDEKAVEIEVGIGRAIRHLDGLCFAAPSETPGTLLSRESGREQAARSAAPAAQGEAEAFAFLDGMYAIREDDVDPDYAARKWSQRGHVTPDEEDRAIVARMLGRAAPAPTAPRVEDDRGVDRGDPARYWSKKTEGAGEADGRLASCVASWPGCYDDGYDPRCCRFPKACSPYSSSLPDLDVAAGGSPS